MKNTNKIYTSPTNLYELFVNCYYQNNIHQGSREVVFNQAQSKWNEIKNDLDKVKEYTKNSLGNTEPIDKLTNKGKKKNLFYSKKTNRILYLKEKHVDSNFDSRSFSKKTKSDRSLKFQKLFQKRFLDGNKLPQILDQDLGFQTILKQSMNNWGELAELFTVYYNGLKRSPQSKSLLAQILDNLIHILTQIKSELKLLIRDTLREIDSNSIDIINDSNELKTKVNHMKESFGELNTISTKAKSRLRKRIYRQRAQMKDRIAKNQKKDQNNSKKSNNIKKKKPNKKATGKPKKEKELKSKQEPKKQIQKQTLKEIKILQKKKKKITKKRKKITISKNIKRKRPATKKPRIQPKILNNKEIDLESKKESQILSKINTFDDLLFCNFKNQTEQRPVIKFTQEKENVMQEQKKRFGCPKLFKTKQIKDKKTTIEAHFEDEKIFPHISNRKRKKTFLKKDEHFHSQNNENHNFTIHLKKSPNHISLFNKSESLKINDKKNDNQYTYIKNEYCNLDKNNNDEDFYILNLNTNDWHITAKEILKNNYQLKDHYPLNNNDLKIIYHQIRYAKILIIDDIIDCFNINTKCKANLEYQLLEIFPIILIRKKETSIIVDIQQFIDPQVFNSFLLLEDLLNSNTSSMDRNCNSIGIRTGNYGSQNDYSNLDLDSSNFNLNEISQENEKKFQFYSQILKEKISNNMKKKIDNENQIYDWIEFCDEKDCLNEQNLIHDFPDFLQDLFQFIKIESKKLQKKNKSILEQFQTVNLEKGQINKKNDNNGNKKPITSSKVKFIKKKKRVQKNENNYSQEQNEKEEEVEEELGNKKQEKEEEEIEIKKELEMGKAKEKQKEEHKQDEKINIENNSQTKKKHILLHKNVSNNLNETNHKIGFCYSHTQIRLLLEFSQMFSEYSSIISCGKLCYFNCNNNIWEPSLNLISYFQNEFSFDQGCNIKTNSRNHISLSNSSVIYQKLIISSGYLILNLDNKKNYYNDQLKRKHLHISQIGNLNLTFRTLKKNPPNIQSNINDLIEIIKKNKKPIISLLVNYDDLEMETNRKSSIFYFGRLWKDLNLDILNIVSYSERKNYFNPINNMNQILKGILERKQNSLNFIDDNRIEIFRSGCLELIKDLENFDNQNKQSERINQKLISRLKNLTNIFQNTSSNSIHITNCCSKYPNDTPYPYNDYQQICDLLNTNNCNEERIHDYQFYCRHLKRSPYLLSFQKCKQLDCSYCNKNPIKESYIFNIMTQFNNSELIIKPSKSLNFIGHYQTFLEKFLIIQNTLL
ncbi:hypothetical protein M0813_09893 [Anaeramoeba flamelloides]|uniref:Uncharacterized protein n=1 Tax=Anaeramoeba flamelloides TaxID=1746091 RepID=A0ABQ8X5P4_9EUKA|nr:hypothetical protein M0813_09893 [Anaeramoeba flamelloides]